MTSTHVTTKGLSTVEDFLTLFTLENGSSVWVHRSSVSSFTCGILVTTGPSSHQDILPLTMVTPLRGALFTLFVKCLIAEITCLTASILMLAIFHLLWVLLMDIIYVDTGILVRSLLLLLLLWRGHRFFIILVAILGLRVVVVDLRLTVRSLLHLFAPMDHLS